MSNASVGRWAALFGGRRSFDQEIASAVELAAAWTRGESDPDVVDVVVAHMPGWLPPLWGTDDRNLYLRRPEGIWRCSLPEWLDDDARVGIWMRIDDGSADSSGDSVVGGVFAGAGFRAAGGWWGGYREGEPKTGADIDNGAHPRAFSLAVNADEFGGAIVESTVGDDGQPIFLADDSFARPPRFEVDGDYLIASDGVGGIRVAYGVAPGSAARAALNKGALRLCFGGRWLPVFTATVGN